MKQSRVRLGVLLAGSALVVLLAGAPAQAKVPRSFTGMLTDDIGAYTPGARGTGPELAAMQRLGVGQLRQTFDSRAPAAATVSNDAFVLEAARHHIRILPQILDNSRYHVPADARHGLRPPHRYGQLARFAARLARRYGPRGTLWRHHRRLGHYAIRAWQIWNEPNLPVWWRPRPNPRAYAQMCKVVGRAIHRVDRHALVLSAGIPDSTQSKPRNYRRYLAAFLRAGGWRWVDGVGAHVYVHSVREIRSELRTYRRTMNAHHGRRLKILVSEIGWASAGHRNPMVVGRRGQARRIRGGFRLIGHLRHRYRIAGVFYFKWKDDPIRPGDPRGNTWGYHTGLLNVGGGHKPAYAAFKHAVARLHR